MITDIFVKFIFKRPNYLLKNFLVFCSQNIIKYFSAWNLPSSVGTPSKTKICGQIKNKSNFFSLKSISVNPTRSDHVTSTARLYFGHIFLQSLKYKLLIYLFEKRYKKELNKKNFLNKFCYLYDFFLLSD